jgi:hypothetical protein
MAIAPEWVEIPAGISYYGDDEISKEWKGAAHPRQTALAGHVLHRTATASPNQEFLVFVEV